jgi:hypothetical protein
VTTHHVSNGTGPTARHDAAQSTAHPTTEQIEADIRRQREELAGTVTALQAKLDVKARAKHRADDLRSQLTTADGKPRPELVATATAVVVVAVAVAIVRRRR